MRIAFIGLGAMGLPMARRLAGDPGLGLTLFDASPDAMARADFGQHASSAADAIESAELIATMLPADAHVSAVAETVREAGRPGQIYVDFSTISPAAMDAVARSLAGAGIAVVSASCMKSVAAARTGELSLFVGGDPAVTDRLGPVLARLATSRQYVGSIAAAKSLKIINNVIVSTLDLMLSEALLIGARLGLPPDAAAGSFAEQGADSWALRNHIVKHALTDDLGPGIFSVAYMAKDVRLAVSMADELGWPVFFAGLLLSAYRGLIAHGHADDYHPVVLRWLEAGANSGPVTEVAGAQGDLVSGQLTPAVTCLQSLITLEALHLARGAGLDEITAAWFLSGGSAANDFLARLAAPGDGGGWPALATMLDHIARGCELAQEASVPAMSFETGRNLVLALMDRWGKSASLADVIAG
jgi:3-hydroxyisobutyrate dehydrogenase-like beta-hydroxyacid dehydrogenase